MKETSYWIDTMKKKYFYPSITSNIKTDILIIGAGMSGLSCAYHLSKYNKQITVVEANKVGYGASGRNTGKLSAQHGLIYHKLIESIGLQQAKLHYQAQKQAISEITALCKKHAIPIYPHDTILYATTPQGKQQLQDEYQAYIDLQIPCSFIEHIDDIPNCIAALTMHKQAIFHPYHFLQELSSILTKQQVAIFEDSPVSQVLKQPDQTYNVICNEYTITANTVICTTQVPIIDHGHLYVTKMQCEQEHIHTLPNKKMPTCLQIDDQKHSFNTFEHTLFFVHHSHKSGITNSNLTNNSSFNQTASYHWSNSDYTTIDKLPFIGPIDKQNYHLLFASGYGKWGNTNGYFAGKLLSEYVLQQHTPYHTLYSPFRKLCYTSSFYLKENIQNMTNFFIGHISIYDDELPQPLQGKKIRKNNHTYGAYREEDGTLYIVDITCPHLGCICNFNEIDKTWDCPCHGSRYTYKGEIIKGPSTTKLNAYTQSKNHIDPHIFEKR